MANEYRALQDYQFGTLLNAAAISDTTLTSNGFTDLFFGLNTGYYLPICLGDPATEAFEIVWAKGHASGSNQLTSVERGKESTTARAWPAGTQWAIAPTRRDFPIAQGSGSSTSDLHVGGEVVETDTGLLKRKTHSSGLVAGAGICLPADVGKTAANTNIPGSVTILKRIGCIISTAPSGGAVTVTFPSAFPNGCIGGFARSIDANQFYGDVVCDSFSTTGMIIRPFQFNGTAPGVCSLYYEASGY